MKFRKISFITVALATGALAACSSGEVKKAPPAPKKEYKPTSAAAAQPRATPQEDRNVLADPDYRNLQTLYGQGKFEALIQKATELEKKSRPNLLLVYVRNLKGLAYLGQKKPLLGIAQFQRALDYNTSDTIKPYLLYNLAAALSDADQSDDSLETLKEIPADRLNTDTRAKYHSLKGKNWLQKGNSLEAARETLEASRIWGRENGLKPNLIDQLDRALAPIAKQEDLQAVLTGLEASPLADRVRSRLQPGLSLNAPAASSTGNSRTVGVLLPLSGRFSAYGTRALKAIAQAFRLYDPEGQEYTLQVEDSGDTPESAIRALNRLANQRDVALVVGPLLSKGIEQITTRAETLGLPLLTLSQGEGSRGEYVFSAGLTPKLQASEIAKYAVEKLGLKRFAILHPRDRFGEQYAQSFWDAVEKLGGSVAGIESYTPGETDFRFPIDRLIGTYYQEARTRELEALAKQREELKITKKTRKTVQYFELPPIVDFDAVFIPDEPKVVGQILPTFAYRDVEKAKFLGISTWNSPELVERARNWADGTVFVDALFPESANSATQKFLTRYSRDSGEAPASSIEAMAYDAGLAAESVLREFAPGTVSRADVKSKLKGVRGLRGATGELHYEDGAFARDLTLLTIRNGKIEAL